MSMSSLYGASAEGSAVRPLSQQSQVFVCIHVCTKRGLTHLCELVVILKQEGNTVEPSGALLALMVSAVSPSGQL